MKELLDELKQSQIRIAVKAMETLRIQPCWHEDKGCWFAYTQAGTPISDTYRETAVEAILAALK